MKSAFKEIIIILLLLLAILLVLGIFLYDYIPTNKIVPKVEQYQVPNSIQEELSESITDIEEGTTQIVYEIDGTDLNNYEKTKDYEKGKANPFGVSTADATTTNGDTTDTSTDNQGTTSSSTTNTQSAGASSNKSNSVGNYLPNTGTK